MVIKGTQEGNAATVLLRGANDFLLDEMDRSLHDSFCIVKRVLESGTVVPGENAHPAFRFQKYLAKYEVILTVTLSSITSAMILILNVKASILDSRQNLKTLVLLLPSLQSTN